MLLLERTGSVFGCNDTVRYTHRDSRKTEKVRQKSRIKEIERKGEMKMEKRISTTWWTEIDFIKE